MSYIAGGQIDFKGRIYNYGDEVPQELAKEHPQWVLPKPLSDDEIASMKKVELVGVIRTLSNARRDHERSVIVNADGDERDFDEGSVR